MLSVYLTGASWQVIVGHWKCDETSCRRTVEYDGSAEALFSFRRRNKRRRWMLFTRALMDNLFSFIISARSTYTAATRHLSASILCFNLRRQDVVKLGTAMLRTFLIPPETARCPLCGPNPEFIVIDGQALGCTDPDDAQPSRMDEECPVLDIAATKLCVVEQPGLRAAITKVLRSSSPLTETQVQLLRRWHRDMLGHKRPLAEGGAAYLFFHFFPFGADSTPGPGQANASQPASAAAPQPATTQQQDGSVDNRKVTGTKRTLESAVRQGPDGELTLGGSGAPVTKTTETWRDRSGHCAPNFSLYPRVDDGAWLAIVPFLQALLAETVSGMFHGHDEKAVRLLANTLRLMPAGAWRDVTDAVDGVGFVASFIGRMAAVVDMDARFRVGLGQLLLAAVEVEVTIDDAFQAAAGSSESIARGRKNAAYCKQWGGTPTPAVYRQWRASRTGFANQDVDDPYVSFEFFASLCRVRPGIKDSEAAKRRVGYRGKDRHAADMEEGDACNKAFSIKFGLTQGVFNVVCPHVVTLGFRCLFRAESVGEALSIVLERFPKLPKVIFYDVACKLDKNALRRVRPIMRAHGVRCILDRPHSITHTCSPVYMPDESLGSTAGVATQAAEVSHSIAAANRTSLAYMAPATYMAHKMAQVAMMNIRKIHRMSQANSASENDHVVLSPFFHSRLSRVCLRGSVCSCQAGLEAFGRRDSEGAFMSKLAARRGGHVDDDAGASPAEAACHVTAAAVAGSDVAADGDSQALPVAVDERGRVDVKPDVGHGAACDDTDTAPPNDPSVDPATTSALGQTGAARIAPPHLGMSPLSTVPLRACDVALVNSFTADLSRATPVRAENKARTVLYAMDFLVLREDRWLTDEVMNSFVALINYRARQAAGQSRRDDGSSLKAPARASSSVLPRVFMFNTFFFSRLIERSGIYDYAGVRNWGRKGDLRMDAVDIIIVPINEDDCHWVLVVVDVRAREFVMYDPMVASQGERYIPAIRRWLADEVTTRLSAEAASEWDVGTWPTLPGTSFPRQQDHASCGVFALAVADCIALGVHPAFSQTDVAVLRQRLSLALYEDDICSANRRPSLAGDAVAMGTGQA